MDPGSLLTGLAGLVATLETLLHTLQSFTTNLASTRLDAVDAGAEDPLRDLRFFWVTLQVRHILDQTDLSGIRAALKSIPSDIHQIVNNALRMVKLQDENRAELAHRALALLTAAQAPLTAEALCHALGLAQVLSYKKRPSKLLLEEIPNPESIIECCMGLIKMESTTRVVTLAHYDILQEMRARWTEIFGSDQMARLAETCIAYLSLADFSRGPCHVIATLRERLEEHPFLDYASRYWGFHAREALLLPLSKAHVKDDIHWFLKQPMNLALSLQVSNYDPESKQESLDIDSESLLRSSGLQIASRHGLAAIVEDFLSMNLDIISTSDRNGRTALHEAAQAGWEDIVSMLIDNGADLSVMDDEEKTPFFYAAECGHAGVISILEKHHVRDDHHQRVLEEALCDAAEAGETSVVEKILHLGVNAEAEKSDITAMAAASRRGHKQIIRLLLDKGASVSYDDGLPSDSIPLHQAIKNGHVEIAALLLDFGANVQTRDVLNRTALFETLGKADIRGAALLLRNGIDISCRDSVGNTVLHEASRRGSVELASRLVDRGAGVTIPNKQGLTPLHLAAKYGHLEIAALLLQKGATVDARDNSGWNPLMHAASAGNTQLCKILLDSSAYTHEVEVGQRTPLYSAEETSHHQVPQSPLDIMLDQGPDLIERKSTPKTSHMLAVGAETSAVPESSKLRANMNDLRTALSLATEAGHADILKLLLDHGARFGSTTEEYKARELLSRIEASGKDHKEEK